MIILIMLIVVGGGIVVVVGGSIVVVVGGSIVVEYYKETLK